MTNDYKTSIVEPEQQSAVLDEPSEESLATQALEDIRKTEGLSGVGRFATKMQSFFQASNPSRVGQQSPHLKAAPIMMAAGLLLLLATGLLFLLSKPESSVHSHFRAPTSLSGADDRKPVSASTTDSPVTENQLVGADDSRESQTANRARTAARSDVDATGHRFSLADERGQSNGAGSLQNPATASELQNPATVFVAGSPAIPVLNLPSTAGEPRGSDVQLPSGTEIIAHTTNAISSGLESPVIAVVDRNVQIGISIVIPQGARVIGYTICFVAEQHRECAEKELECNPHLLSYIAQPQFECPVFRCPAERVLQQLRQIRLDLQRIEVNQLNGSVVTINNTRWPAYRKENGTLVDLRILDPKDRSPKPRLVFRPDALRESGIPEAIIEAAARSSPQGLILFEDLPQFKGCDDQTTANESTR